MDESAARVVDFYRRHAHRFDTERSRSRFEKGWLDRFAALVSPGGTILDVGCGMGEPIARYFIERGFPVHGIDSSPEMIDLCRSRFPEHSWQVADMRELSLGRIFDGIVAWDSFFHLDHDAQRAMFAIFAAHAKPAGPLLFTTGPGHSEAVGQLWGEPLYHASLAPQEYRQRLRETGFDVVHHVAEDPACDRHTVWLARRAEDH